MIVELICAAAAAAVCVLLCTPSARLGEQLLQAVSAAALACATVLLGDGSGLQATIVIIAAAAVIDARTMRIPNTLSVTAAVSAAAAWWLAGAPFPAGIIAVLTAVLMVFAYLFGAAGAGDAKALPSLVLAVAVTAGNEMLAAVALTSWLLVAMFGFTLLLHIACFASRREFAPLGPGMFIAGAGVLMIVN